MMYYSSVKKNEVVTLAGKWMELEVILSKVSQTKTNNMFLYVNIYARVSCVDVCVWMCPHT